LIVRTSGDPATIVPMVRQALREADSSLPLSSVATIDELVARSLEKPRSLSFLIGSLAIVALSLSVIGIYGVMAYYVQQHTKEIGIWLALGGSRREVLRLIVGQRMTIVATDVAIGLLAALTLSATDGQRVVRRCPDRSDYVRGCLRGSADGRASRLFRARHTCDCGTAGRCSAERIMCSSLWRNRILG
jgi:predicted lysophospholipase L1 biosynthesis ABC-type transport system permease subunit